MMTESYKVTGRQEMFLEPALEYKIHTLEMSTEDRQSLQFDPFFIPSPRVEERRSHSFQLPLHCNVW